MITETRHTCIPATNTQQVRTLSRPHARAPTRSLTRCPAAAVGRAAGSQHYAGAGPQVVEAQGGGPGERQREVAGEGNIARGKGEDADAVQVVAGARKQDAHDAAKQAVAAEPGAAVQDDDEQGSPEIHRGPVSGDGTSVAHSIL